MSTVDYDCVSQKHEITGKYHYIFTRVLSGILIKVLISTQKKKYKRNRTVGLRSDCSDPVKWY